MKLLLTITVPAEPFNSLARSGVVGQKKIGAIIEATKPETIYFTGNESGRGAVAMYELASGAELPAAAEPWFLTFNVKIVYSCAIPPQELMASGLEDIVKKWA